MRVVVRLVLLRSWNLFMTGKFSQGVGMMMSIQWTLKPSHRCYISDALDTYNITTFSFMC